MTRGKIATNDQDLEEYRALRARLPATAIPIISVQLGISSATLYGRLQGARPVTREAVLALERLVDNLSQPEASTA